MKTEKEHTRLCDRCIHLFEVIENKESDSIDPFHEDETALKQSIDADCSICRILWKSGRFVGSDRVIITRAGGYIDLRFESSRGDSRFRETRLRKFVLSRVEDDETLLRGFQKEMVEDSNDSEASLNLAATLLDRCVSSHVDCIPNRQPSSYPHRLLDLQQDTIRLIDTRETHVFGPYATLSHTWGNADIKVLTHQTLSDFQTGFGIDEFPATFRDTIRVIRHLNIPYLWIDCCCIMQSEESGNSETLMEIAKMGEVYSNAILNVGATSAKSPLDGLFSRRRTCCRPMTIDFTSTYLLHSASCNGQNHHWLFSDQVSAIATRAWCMQERFLCPRMLHFWKYGIFWECHAMHPGSERLPTQAFPVRQTMNYMPFSLRTEGEIPAGEHLKDWHQIVARYSAMGLSRPNKDKLAACGAVAKVMAELIGDEYIAGHFRQSLFSSLTWRISHNHKSGGMFIQRSKVWRAPSWSWTSMDGAVFIGGDDRDDSDDDDDDENELKLPPTRRWKLWKPSTESDKTAGSDEVETVRETKSVIEKSPVGPCAQLISVNIELIDPSNPYGALKSAAITVKGPVTEVEHDATDSEHRREWQSCIRWGNNHIDVTFDDPSETRRNLVILVTRIHRGRMQSLDWRLGGPRVRGNGPLLSGLVLNLFQTRPQGQPDVYRRVGAFCEEYFGDQQQSGRSNYERPEFERPEDRVIMIV